MKIVNLIGGLGNQMFQYAFALSLRERFPDEEVLIDTSHFGHVFFKHYKGANLHNGYEIDRVFPNACLPVAKPSQLMRVTWYMPNYVLSRILRRLLPVRRTEVVQSPCDYFAHRESYYAIEGDCYYEGIWESAQNYLPIRERIQEVFAHGEANAVNRRYILLMEQTHSVGIHIRRGDYLNNASFSGICGLDYYTRAIQEILKDGQRHHFFIFSNDLSWCETHIAPLCEGHDMSFVRENMGNDSCWDMFLMAHCKDLVLANSSFSWWGAFLNRRGGRVVAPRTWVNREAEFDIWLDEWIRL